MLDDLASGKPMDRLICGDVGFGKTEVALRAAFVAAMSGKQVAVVVPTTLLARQHYRTFTERFAGPAGAHRPAVAPGRRPRRRREIKEELAEGTIDIVIGTHALLAKDVAFKHLGLLIVDEEQHFGVAHKERLKQLRADVHVLTLTATPIPRTLQLALTGVREMSLIATPPVDRLAVRTFVMPYDPVTIREAIMREHYRGGQIFYVCPRIEDLDEVRERLRELVPEIKLAIGARPAWPPTELEEVMTAFDDARLRPAAVDQHHRMRPRHPAAPTRMIIHRADMFGLAQLYQLRGRIGRGKVARLRLSDRAAGRSAGARRRSAGSRSCRRWTRWAPASSWRATTSTSAAPAICWARSSRAISARSASSSTSRCWRRRCAAARSRRQRGAGAARSGRRRSRSARRC